LRRRREAGGRLRQALAAAAVLALAGYFLLSPLFQLTSEATVLSIDRIEMAADPQLGG